MATPHPTLSVCMIVRDEESTLPRALTSVAGLADEVIVVDTGSVDGTLEIAREHGATTESFAWTSDFSAARNHAASLANGDWILALDADEEASDDFRARLAGVLAGTAAGGLCVPVLNVSEDGGLQLGAGLVRLYRNRAGYRFEGRIHEEVAPSIVRAGGAVETADLPLIHRGYTRSEDRRKGRRGRNLALLERAHAECPSHVRYWHYLGLEHLATDNLSEARRWFERVVSEQPGSVVAGWSASLLTHVLVRQREMRRAWEVALFGTKAEMGRVMCLTRLGGIALGEGDDVTAERCADDLERVQPGTTGDTGTRAATVVELRAGAAWERGDRELAVSALETAAREHPGHGGLAEAYVRRSEELRCGLRGAVEAMRKAPLPHVIAASLGALGRQGHWTEALDLASQWKVESVWAAHALLRSGRQQDGVAMLLRLGEQGKVHAMLWGLERGDEALVSRALDDAPRSWQAVARGVSEPTATVPPAHAWLAWSWAQLWIDLRGLILARRLLGSVTPTEAEAEAAFALLLYRAGDPMRALPLALRHPEQPDAQEMAGLFCHERGDMAGAAELLLRRVRAGDASVRVHAKGAEALQRTGRGSDARGVIDLGRVARPHSMLLEKRAAEMARGR